QWPVLRELPIPHHGLWGDFSTSAVSATLSPPKKRSSTTWLFRSYCAASDRSALSMAMRSSGAPLATSSCARAEQLLHGPDVAASPFDQKRVTSWVLTSDTAQAFY